MLAYDAGGGHPALPHQGPPVQRGGRRHQIQAGEHHRGPPHLQRGHPPDLGFVDRSDPEQMFEPEINFVVGKKQLGKIIDRCISKHGFTVSAGMLDAIKDLGYHYSTIGSLTVAIADMTVPHKKYELIGETEKEIVKIDRAVPPRSDHQRRALPPVGGGLGTTPPRR